MDPYAIGFIKDRTGNQTGGLLFPAALLFVAFGMMAMMRLASARDPAVVPGQARHG